MGEESRTFWLADALAGQHGLAADPALGALEVRLDAHDIALPQEPTHHYDSYPDNRNDFQESRSSGGSEEE